MRTNLKERAGRIARYVARLDEVHQRHFIAIRFECFSEKERLKRFEWVSHLVYPKSKWLKINNWMEKAFTQDMKKTPKVVATMCRHCFGINPKMMPFLVKTAQRVKLRIRARRRLHPENFAVSETGEGLRPGLLQRVW